MNRTLNAALCLCLALALAQAAAPQNAFAPDQIKWGQAPAFMAPGASLAVLEGNPMAKSGDFTIRLKMLDGTKSPRIGIPTARTSRFFLETSR